METRTSFGYWIRRQRKALDLTQQALADQVGCSLAAIKKIEQDERRPSRQIVELLADVLGVPAGQHEIFLEIARGVRPVEQLSLAQEPVVSALPTGIVTFLFTDIEDSTKLAQEHAEEWETLRARHHRILRETMEAHQGYVFQVIGDACCAAFRAPKDGLQAAVEAQRKLQTENWGKAPLNVRMGIHAGEAEAHGNEYYGYLTLSLAEHLTSAAHGGQVLLSQVTENLLDGHLPQDVSLLDLGEHKFKDIQQPVRVFQVIAPDLQNEFPGLRVPGALPNNLPIQLSSFIGREKEITEVIRLLGKARLVTLTGTGGIGKTRLSLQVAEEMLDQFPQGVIFVPLADDTDVNQFISRVAQHLEVREGSRSLFENVKDYLRDKRLLLVLDNFEQLVAAAPVVIDLLTSAPKLKILVTSRIALNVHGEHNFPVPPLEVPQTEIELQVEDLTGNESVLLFVERAHAVRPSFALTHENASAVAEICHHLDGLPLALELAAARVKLLSPRSILGRLGDRLKLLTGGARNLPPRQQTLRNTLEWSCSLLNQHEKILYARLGVFVGGFTLEAAETVCAPDGRIDILDGLTSLLNNSLLQQEDTTDDEPRFWMLETIRAYALEQLTKSGEMETLRERHARHFGNIVVAQTWTQLISPNALYWLNWLEREYDNIRATLTWCLSASGGIDLGAQLVFALEWFWYRRGYFNEGRMWCERVLASSSLKAASRERALALLSSGVMALWQGRPETGLAELQEALALGHRYEDEFIISTANHEVAVTFINMGRDSQAKPLLAQGQAFFKEKNYPYFHAITNVHLGNVELGLGNIERAQALHEEALAEAREIGENWLISFALNNLGEVARAQRQYNLAHEYYEQCEALLRETGDKDDVARFVHTLGYIAQHEGDYALAESQFRKSLTMFRRLGNRRGIAECLAGLAGWKARQGDPGWGATMLSAAEYLLHSTGGEWWPADRMEVERTREIIRSALTEDEFANAWKTGAAMTIDQAISFASNES